MNNTKNKKFLSFFPDHCYRYIDQTGNGRPPISSLNIRDDLNIQGYESYFTVNGFKDATNAQKDNCTSLNAFFVDIDGRKDHNELELIKERLNPTFILETKNGYHIYWLLDEPIYKEDLSEGEWKLNIERWEKQEQSIVESLKADPVVKDLTRILRVPDTYYWKKTGDLYKSGVEGVFKIKGIYKNIASRYTFEAVEEAFPLKESVSLVFSDSAAPNSSKIRNQSEATKRDFFNSVNEKFPIEERDSFNKLVSGAPGTIPFERMTGNHVSGANNALLVTASLMKQAGWTKEKALQHIGKVGWHGIEKENGGTQEIMNTINSAYSKGYTYSHKNEIIAHNMTDDEQRRMDMTFMSVQKDRKEIDKVRFSTYEHELLAGHPYLKKNDIGMVFNYDKGVYKVLSDQEISDLVLTSLYDDLLWGYRTKRNVSDKVACLLSIIPTLVLSDDKGYIANVKNGLLNIHTRELMPHTPDFVSLIQYPVDYDPLAEAPIWEECVTDWVSGPESKEKKRLLQQFCGYILSSSMLYDRALFMVGDGGNGKSTFIDTISMIIGSQATSHLDLEALYGHFGMHGLIGKRLNIIEEVAGNYYQSNKLKKLISGEQVTIDIKYKPQFTFRPQAKFVFSVNMFPRVDDTSTATERRICAIQFLNNYRKNPNVKLRSNVGLLAKELSGILNWMLDGAKDLAENGNFVITEEQTRMLDEYRQENSSVEGFISECIDLNPDGEIESPELYSEYKKWTQSDGGRKTKSNITFSKEFKAYGDKGDRFSFSPRTSGSREARFIGISFNPHWIKQSRPLNGF